MGLWVALIVIGLTVQDVTRAQQMDYCERPPPVYRSAGDAVVAALFDVHRGTNCSEIVPVGLQQMATAAWFVEALNRVQFLPGIQLGMALYDTCSSPLSTQRAMAAAILERDCQSAYPLGVVTTADIARHVHTLASTFHVPVLPATDADSSTSSAAVVSTLLKALNWTSVDAVVAADKQVTAAVKRAAAAVGACVRRESVLLHRGDHRTHGAELWTALESEPTSRYLVVAVGHASQLTALVRGVHGDGHEKVQWLLVCHDGESMDNLPQDAILVRHNTAGIEELEVALQSLQLTITTNDTDLNLLNIGLPVSTTRENVHSVATPILKMVQKLKIGLENHCGGALGGTCANLPPFDRLPPSPVNIDVEREIDSVLSRLQTSVSSEQRAVFVSRRHPNGSVPLLDSVGLILGSEVSWTAPEGPDLPTPTRSCTLSDVTVMLTIEEVHPWPISWRPDAWAAAVAAVGAVGVSSSIAVVVFMCVRMCKGDVLEGNPFFSFLLLLAIVLTYCSVVPFGLLIAPTHYDYQHLLCGLRLFSASLSYALLFSVMLSRGLLLASCDEDGGFLSHVNGYLQSVLCFFVIGVQVALSAQFWAINWASLASDRCSSVHDGYLFLLLLSYDAFLLVLLVCVCPFIVRSKRNYREGMFFTAAALLTLLIWGGWVSAYVLLPRHWQDVCVSAGLTATATAVLVTVFIPRTYLMMTAIVRDHLASALPSLAYTSATSVQDVHYRITDTSNHALYDSVNPLPGLSNGQVNPSFYSDPTLPDPPSAEDLAATEPLRGLGSRRTLTPENTYERYDTPPSPSKVTRF